MDRHTLTTGLRWAGRCLGWLPALMAAGSLAGSILPPERAGLCCALLATLQPLIAALLLTATLFAVAHRRWRTVFVFVILLALLLPTTLTYAPIGRAAPWPEHHRQAYRTFTIMTFNANGFEFQDKALRHKPSENTRTILQYRPDVVILQEPYICRMVYYDLHSVAMLRDSLDALYPYRSIGFENVMILSKYPFTLHPVEPAELNYTGGTMPRDIFHHFAMAYDVNLPGLQHPLRIIGCHLASFKFSQQQRSWLDNPNTPPLASEHHSRQYIEKMRRNPQSFTRKLTRAYRLRAAQAKRVRHIVQTSPTPNVIVCGDFNDTPSSYAYRVVATAGLHDARTECNIGPIATYNAHRLAVDIDHILYRGVLQPVAYANLHKGNSDHNPQIAVFRY